MLGNDVVDLFDPEAAAGARHARFDERVFTARERGAIERSSAPERLRWAIWAAKESAFKAARKLDPRIVFSQRRFETVIDGEDVRTVIHGSTRWSVRTRFADGAVHAVARDERNPSPEAELITGCERVAGGDSSAAVRRLAIEQIAERLGIEATRLEIARTGRIPFVLLDGEAAPFDLSLSHHGAVVAFAASVGRRG